MALPAADITSSDFKARAYDYYAKLRAQAPVHTARLPGGHTPWLVSRYDDVATLLKDARLVKDRRNAAGSRPFSRLPGMLGFLQSLERNMLDLDAPDHTRPRGLVHLAFTPRLVDRMRSRIEQLSEDLLARAMVRGSMDLIADYALPIPLTVIAEMLGIPAADQLRFHRWSSAIVASTAAPNNIRVLPAVWRFVRYPLVVAGHETTVNLIGNGALALMQFPDQLERLRADPRLDATAIEELLRFHSPIEVSTERYAREMIEIAGLTIPTGALVYGLISSANRDETQFEDPERLDLGREKNRANRHRRHAPLHGCRRPLPRSIVSGRLSFDGVVSSSTSSRGGLPRNEPRARPRSTDSCRFDTPRAPRRRNHAGVAP